MTATDGLWQDEPIRPDDDPTSKGLPALPEPRRHECDHGWVNTDPPTPCPICKPHLSSTQGRWTVRRPPPERNHR